MEDNSCVMKYIEIVPCDNYNNCSDVPDIKQEPVYVKIETDDDIELGNTVSFSGEFDDVCSGVSVMQQSTSEEPQAPVHHLQNTAVPVICYKTADDDKTSIGHHCEEWNDQRDDSISLLYNDFTSDHEHSLEVKVEADSNDITEHPHDDDDKPRPYSCTVCNKQFATKKGLNIHELRHSGQNSFSCIQCEKRFSTQHDLKTHMDVHGSKYKCTECGKCFQSNHTLTEHMRVHSGEKPYECYLCDKAFSQSRSLNRHMRVHTGDRPYKCSLCNEGFTQSCSLQRHKQRFHSISRPYQCSYCGKLFNTDDELKCHVRIHTGAKPYSCRHCSYCFARLDKLKSHMLKSHNEGTWLTCHICQKEFSESGSLSVHIRRHVGVKPYVCCECPKTFCTSTELKSHILIHSHVKRFCCGWCGKSFRHKVTFVSHFKKCSGNPEFTDIGEFISV